MKKSILLMFLLLLSVPFIIAQEKTITGKVVSSDGTVLPGVNVLIEGTFKGAITNLEGNYTITADDESTLIFQFLGYESVEELVGNRTVIDVSLAESFELIDEVVVIGYGETTRRSFTGSLSSVDADEIENIPQQDAVSMMQGRAAGVYVNEASGLPGSASSILIRGLGTLNGTGAPLIVVDGIPAANFDAFNPNDIKTITFLKDAAATSIYGSRAAGGVVLITTKDGRSGKTQFDVNAQFGFTDLENPNDFRLMNAQQYIEYYREAAINAGIDPDDPGSGTLYLPLNGDYYDTDWFDEVTRQGTLRSYEVSASGGKDATSFYISLGYFDEKGVVIGTGFERYTGRLNLKHSVSDKLNLEFKLFGSVNNQDDQRGGGGGRSGNLSGSYLVSPLSPVLADENTPFNFIGQGYNFDLPTNAGHNPVAVAALTKNYLEEYRALPSLRINFLPLNNFKIWASASYDFSYATRKETMSKFYLGETEGGTSDQTWSQFSSSNYTIAGEYMFDLGDDHSLDLLVGGESFKTEGENSNAGSQTFGFDAINNFAAGQATSVGSLGYEYFGNTLLSAFTRLDYSMNEKLFLHGSFRRDGSSVFGPDNRWGNFYAFGLGYSLSDEPFIENSEAISTLKLKASYGIAGNPNSGDFEWRATYSGGGAYNLPGAANPGTAINTPGNEALKWEQSAQTNIGFDLGLMDDRILATVEYYNIKSIDLISARPVSVTSGFTSIIDNVAEIKNNGFELSLSTVNVSTSFFTWTTTLNLTRNYNEVVSLTSDADTLILDNRTAHIEGQPAYQWFMPAYAGVDPATGSPLYINEAGETTLDYSEAVVAVQGDNPDISPKFFGGFGNTFTFGGFTLSGLFYFRSGGEIYRELHQSLMLSGSAGGSNQSVDELGRWQNSGDVTDIPRADANYSDPGPSSRWLEDASFIRLRNLNLSYALPQGIVTRLGMSNLAVSFRAVNLLTFTKFGGLDVTTGAISEDDDYPVPRRISFGLSATF